MSEEDLYDEYPLSDDLDREILMHRDAHFGGSFDVMMEYYLAGGKGVQPHFEVARMNYLKAVEEETGENLAPMLLSGVDAEKIARSRDKYKTLRAIYEKGTGSERYPTLIADLILSEEEEPTSEIEEIVREEKKIIPFLLDLLKSEEFQDSLFPGYGHAPALAAKCLGKLGDEKVVFSLFQEADKEDFEDEQMIIRALYEIGAPTKEFLLKVIQQKPYGVENERAALVLMQFLGDIDIQRVAVSLLEDPDLLERDVLTSYALLLLEDLSDPELQERARRVLETDFFPKDLESDKQAILRSWQS